MSLGFSAVTFDIIDSESANRFSAVALRAAVITAFRPSDSFLPPAVGSWAHTAERPQSRIAEYRMGLLIQHLGRLCRSCSGSIPKHLRAVLGVRDSSWRI